MERGHDAKHGGIGAKMDVKLHHKILRTWSEKEGGKPTL
jgi:hypothetical protein